MAMSPAAKDPNSFASSNLSGGNSATGAILGIPQDPNTPRGPQPTALPQGAPGGVPNFFASASGGQAPQPQGLQVPGMDQYNQVTAQNQQVIAQMFQPKADEAPQYGIGPNGELQVGDQVVPMQDNPTMAAQAVASPAGKQSVTAFKPGFQPVDSRDVQQYLSGISHGIGSNLYQGAKEFLSRAPGAAIGMGADAAKWAGLEGVGAGLQGAADWTNKATGADHPVDTLGRGTVGSWFVNNAADAAVMLPIIATSMAIPEMAIPRAMAYLGDAALNFGLFGSQAAQQKKESLIAQGVDPAQANKAGWVDFFTQGGGMMAMGAGGRAAGNTYGAAQQIVSKLQQAVGKGAMTAEEAAAAVTNPALLARSAANIAGNIGVQGAAMGAMSGASAASNNAYGGQNQDIGGAVAHGVGAGLSLGALMSPLGLAHQMGDSARRAQLGRDLNTPTQEVDLLNAVKMDQAAKAIQPEMSGLIGKERAAGFTADTQAKSTDAYSDNMIAAERAARNETPGFGGQAPVGAAVAPDAARQADVEAAFPPLTPEQLAAQKTAADATKTQAKADKERSDLAATNALIELGVAQPKGKDVSTMADILASGVDLSAPESATLRDALLARYYNLAKSELAKLKGPNDSTSGPADSGVPPSGAGGAGDSAGSVGAGKPVAGAKPAGGRLDGTPAAPAASGEPPVALGTGVPTAPVAELPIAKPDIAHPKSAAAIETSKAKAEIQPNLGLPDIKVDMAAHPHRYEPTPTHTKAEIPDFSLEHTTGEPSAAWKAAHPEELMGPPDMTTSPKQRVLPGMQEKLKLATKGKTAEQNWESLRTAKLPHYSELTAEEKAIVDAAHAKGELTEASFSRNVEAAHVEPAKQAKKRDEVRAAEEAAKTPKQIADEAKQEAAGKTTIVPEAEWVKAFGPIHGPRIFRRVNGMSFGQIAKETSPGAKTLSDRAMSQSVGRADEKSIAEAVKAGKVDALVGADMARQLETGQKKTVEVKTAAAIAQDGGDSSAHFSDISPEQSADLLIHDGVSVTGADSMGVKSKAEKKAEEDQAKAVAADELPSVEQDKGRGADLSHGEEALVEKAKGLEDEMNAALKSGDKNKASDLRQQIKDLAASMSKAKEKRLAKEQKAEEAPEADLELKLADLNDQLMDAERSGDSKRIQRVQDAIDAVKAKMDKEGTGQEADFERDSKGNMLDESQDPTERNRKSAAGGISKEELQPVVDKIVSSLGGDPSKVQVHDTAPGKDAGSVGGRVDENGVVHLYRDGISSGLEGQKTLFHELFHAGLRKMGIEYHRVLNQLYETHDRVRLLANDWIASSEGQAAKAEYEAKYPDAKNSKAALVAHATDEALARIAEELKTGTGLGTAQRNTLVRGIAKWMAGVADKLGMTKLAQSIRSMTYTRLEKFVQEAIERSVDDRTAQPVGSRQRTVEANIAKLPERYQEGARTAADVTSRWANSALDRVVFTKELVERGVKRGMSALTHYQELLESRNARAGHFQKMAYDAIEDVRKFNEPEKRALSDFLQHSTLEGEWGYGAKATGKAKAMFEALSPRAQTVAKAIFSHGDEILGAKKSAIKELAGSLYDDMLKGATGAERESIIAERDGFLKRYNTLMKIGDGSPYTSARRHGDWIAIGKSPEFLAAEKAAYADGATAADRKAFNDMITDPKHHLVSEAQSEQEAKMLRQNMRDAGYPATGEHTYYKPKEDWEAELNGGKGVIAGMARLRNQLQKLKDESSDSQQKAKYDSSIRLLTNMWLDALSQSSARKAELRRLGVHGTMDMVRAFREQSGSDAHFIAGIEHNDKMLTALKQAYKQADRGEGEDRTTKLNIYSEFMKRHEQGVTNPPTPWANKITKTVALWQIATSPAHYVGNLMQPWTMTLPMLAAKHGYGEATSEFFKAYKEIGKILAGTGLLKSLKVEDMPADVRVAMKRLLELGRLDIGMNTEYTSMDLNLTPKTMVSKAMANAADRVTQASLKMESLNRLASAAAAYRLELKRNGGDHEKAMHYAADVVAETHGDHSKANAPRAFNSGFGKVALQFRKFQLVQLTQMAKMIGDLNHADPAERALAMRTLAYTLAHVGALGGAIGMPGFNSMSAASSAIQKALTGVAGEDWETKIEKMVGDHHVAQLLLRGLPGLLGVDLTSKVGYGDMLGIAPYTDVDVTDRQSVQDAIGQVTAGPFGGLMGRAAQSLHHLMVGNYYKGLEGLMPQGISNVMKGAREGTQGVTNTKGDKLMDLNAGEAMLQAMGFEPSSKAMMQSETGAMLKSTEDFKNRLEIMKERYVNTVRSGGDVSGAVKDMNQLRTQMQDRGFRPTPLGDMLKAPTQQLIREIFTTPGGVQYKPGQTQKAVEQFPK